MRDVTEYGAALDPEGCARGCAVAGVHLATCTEWGQGATDECRGCAPAAVRDDCQVCDRCYTRMLRAIEAVPDLVAQLVALADPRQAARFDKVLVSGSGPEGSPAPTNVDGLDALADIMHTIGAGGMAGLSVTSIDAYRYAVMAVGRIVDDYAAIASDADAFTEWWALIMAKEHPEREHGWTVTRALSRWPLADRRRRLPEPCPACNLKTITVAPPRHQHARMWFRCSSCRWQATELDEGGLWAAAFGYYAQPDDPTPTGRNTTMQTSLGGFEVDLAATYQAGLDHLVETPTDPDDPHALFAAFTHGAVPKLATDFAALAEAIAKYVRTTYKNGDLMAGGARLVAQAMRELAEAAQNADLTPEPEAEPEPAAVLA